MPDTALRGDPLFRGNADSGADFRLLAEALPQAVWICRPDGTLDYMNHQGLEFFGPGLRESMSLFPSGAVVHPEDQERALAAWAHAVRTGEVFNLEARLRRFDGAFRWYLSRAQPVRDAQSNVIKWMGTSTNVHDVKEANDFSAFLLALSTELARIANPQELLCTAMLRLRERLGAARVTLAEIDEGQEEAVILREGGSDGAQIEVASLPLKPFENLAVEAKQGFVTVLGDTRTDSRAGMVDYATQRCIVGINLDVTERRHTEEALKEVNQRKDEILAMLGHELRNPLAPIRNAVQILRVHTTGKPELEWARAVIERQTRHLVRLVDDLLDVSRMVRGQIVLQKVPVELAEIIRHGVETSRPLIRTRKHKLHVHVPRVPVRLDGDLTRLAQVLANLLNNAAKYTDEGGDIWLEGEFEGGRIEGGQVVLRVRDTGPGIAPALLPHVFELFTQAERTLDRSQGGLGIGLTLVKLLVEMHGGSVEAKSAGVGHGAEFVVRLPASGPVGDAGLDQEINQAIDSGMDKTNGAGQQLDGLSVEALSDAAHRRERAMRILIVDDNIDAADSIAMLLSMDGYEAHSVHSATAALEAVASFKPDVVLLDIGLPEMDGYEVARRMRTQDTVESMRLVALTGYGQPADRDRAARAGFDEYLVKPVEPAVLNRILQSLKSH